MPEQDRQRGPDARNSEQRTKQSTAEKHGGVAVLRPIRLLLCDVLSSPPAPTALPAPDPIPTLRGAQERVRVAILAMIEGAECTKQDKTTTHRLKKEGESFFFFLETKKRRRKNVCALRRTFFFFCLRLFFFFCLLSISQRRLFQLRKNENSESELFFFSFFPLLTLSPLQKKEKEEEKKNSKRLFYSLACVQYCFLFHQSPTERLHASGSSCFKGDERGPE